MMIGANVHALTHHTAYNKQHIYYKTNDNENYTKPQTAIVLQTN